MPQPFTLGVNYWPRRKAMYWWSDFDSGEVDDEFAVIQDLGLNTVRIFLLWDDFQPTPGEVAHLDALTIVCDIAAAHHLGLDVTFFTGHMSGPNWSPRWLLGGNIKPTLRQIVSAGKVVSEGYRNMYTDPVALDAERLMLRTVVRTLKDHPAIWMWNLGNEPDLFANPPTADAGRAWVRQMVSLIREIDDRHPITYGLHVADLAEQTNLRAETVYPETDVAVMHSYPMYTPFARHPLDPDYVPFTCALTAALAGKRVLMEEFGGCTAPKGQPSGELSWSLLGTPRRQFMASEEDLADFVQQSLHKLVEVGTTGALIWCFADYPEDLWDRPPCSEYWHERSFGLVRGDGSLKPHAQVLKAFAATHPTIREEMPDWAQIRLLPEEFSKISWASLAQMYRDYLARLPGA
jgi:endo-1,4-beta-mannosidase